MPSPRITPSDAEKLRQIRKDTQAGNEFRDTVADGGHVGPPGIGNGYRGHPRQPRDGFWAKITNNQQYEDPDAEEDADPIYSWTYSFAQVYKKKKGPKAAWEVIEGGITGEAGADSGYAINTVEDINASYGLTGAGININSFPVDPDAEEDDPPLYEVKAIPNGVIVWMRAVVCTDDDGKPVVEYAFSAWNGFDGQCPPPPE